MITAIELTNFKGIADKQRIELSPITLLFGPNSAGKSTILQSLLYLHEVLEHGDADVDRTELGGDVVELGGFARLVHQHDIAREIVIRAEFTTPGKLERFGRSTDDEVLSDFDDGTGGAWWEITARHLQGSSFRAVVQQVTIGLAGDTEPLIWLELGGLRDGEPFRARVNMGHPSIAEARDTIEAGWLEVAVAEHIGVDDGDGYGEGQGDGAGSGLGDGSGFGDGRRLPLFALSRSRLSAIPSLVDPLTIIDINGYEGPEHDAAVIQLRTFLEMAVIGTGVQLRNALRDALYIGPLRAVPPRGFLYEHRGRSSSWADGLGAWDLLLADRDGIVVKTNEWLKTLDARCSIAVQQLFHRNADAEDISADHVDQTLRRLLIDTGKGSLVLPSEVGAGISQVVPVIVAALVRNRGLTLIEQPEIHVHPALQVGLGDLFIQAVNQATVGGAFIIETHSEHLILRLLRRIRETTDKELPDEVSGLTPDQLSVLYVENTDDGVRIRRLRVDEQGEFMDRWPKGFFAERAEELF